MNLTHLDENNRPKMVDVSDKYETKRVAIASGEITMSQEAFAAIISPIAGVYGVSALLSRAFTACFISK